MLMSYERRRGYGGGFRPCPVEIGKEYEVDITETSRQGEGIARIQGFVIFVANAKPRDHARAHNSLRSFLACDCHILAPVGVEEIGLRVFHI